MIKKLHQLLFATLLSLCFTQGYSQFNAATNSYAPYVFETQNSNGSSPGNVTDGATGITCAPNTFWGQGGGVVALTLINGVVTEGATIVQSSINVGFGLAFCNNLNGSYSPTFYSASVDSHHPAWYNGTDWVATDARTSSLLVNAGGNGSYLYYTASDTITFLFHSILKYDGHTLTTAYSWNTSRDITVADISVDDYGNAWVFTGPANGSKVTDSLNVISPSGQLIKQYPFNYDTYNAYGAFLLYDTLYIAIGDMNVENPNTIVPVILRSDSIIAGTPIAFPYGFGDMASCNAGSPLAVKQFAVNATVSVFPDPADDEVTLAGLNTKAGRTELSMFDVLGKEILTTQITSPEYKLQTAQFGDGIYFLEIRNGNSITTQKILVQHN